MAKQIKQLKMKRDIIHGSITRIDNHLKSFSSDAINILEIKNRIAKLENLWTEFNEVQEQIEISEESCESTESFQERERFESKYYELHSFAQNLIQGNSQVSAVQSSDSVDISNPSIIVAAPNKKIRLPVIKLPTFSGAYEDWYTFYNAFTSLVHNDKDLSKVQKLHHLISSLGSEAASYISSLDISDENYDCAWDMLRDRYDNKRLIINKHIQSILDLPSTTKENGIILRQIVDGTVKHLRILKSLELPVDNWDAIIITIISQKLDPITIKDWESTIPRKTIPTLQQLTDFLTLKCSILETVAKKYLIS